MSVYDGNGRTRHAKGAANGAVAVASTNDTAAASANDDAAAAVVTTEVAAVDAVTTVDVTGAPLVAQDVGTWRAAHAGLAFNLSTN
jgi:hypothetical protein